MVIAGLLPALSADRLAHLIPRHELRLTGSWKELASLIDDGVEVGVFDPTVNGCSSLAEVEKFLIKHSPARLLAYVTPTPQNLRAVFRLSKFGLKDVFVHRRVPSEMALVNAIESARAASIAFDLLTTIDDKLANLPLKLSEVLVDLFARPGRYETAVDLAREGEISVKELYLEFSNAGLRTPKQFVVVAKAIHAYGYLQLAKLPERLVCKKLGYSDPKVLLRHIRSIFGRCPMELCKDPRSDGELVALIEWMYKPTCLTLMHHKNQQLGKCSEEEGDYYGSSKQKAASPTVTKTSPLALAAGDANNGSEVCG